MRLFDYRSYFQCPLRLPRSSLPRNHLAYNLLASALYYAQRGLRVIPITPSESYPPLITEWQHKATCDPKQIKEWWATWPEANVAIATGVASGVIVVDVDMKNGKNGKATLSALVKQHGGLHHPKGAVTYRR